MTKKKRFGLRKRSFDRFAPQDDTNRSIEDDKEEKVWFEGLV
ncbi:MAG: hypothetical protein R3B41_00030 [Candidatus Doudnabacteria bacterium]